jgi:hypothetical protein
VSRFLMSFVASCVLAASWAVGQAPTLRRVTTGETAVTANVGTFKVGTLTVSPNGRRFAYARKEGSGFVVEVDGKVEATYKDIGPVVQPLYFDTPLGYLAGIKPMIFSGDSQHLVYGARDGDSWIIVRDGRKGEPFKSVGGPVLSHDGSRLAYAAMVAGGWAVVLDGSPGKTYEKVGPPVFSPDGKRIAHAARAKGREMIVIDGVEGKGYDSVDTTQFGVGLAFPNMVITFPVFSAGGRWGHTAKQGETWRVVLDGQESGSFDEVSDMCFSPDGAHWAVPVRNGRVWTAVVDGKGQGSFDKMPVLVFSQDGKRFAIATTSKDRQSVMVDGQVLGTHEAVGLPVFSPVGNRVAYGVKTGKQWAIVVDGTTQKPYMAVGQPVFSPDGNRVAYPAALAEGRWVVVVEGVEGKEYAGLLKGAGVVFDDNSHLHYLVVSKERVLLVEEELQTGQGVAGSSNAPARGAGSGPRGG